MTLMEPRSGARDTGVQVTLGLRVAGSHGNSKPEAW